MNWQVLLVLLCAIVALVSFSYAAHVQGELREAHWWITHVYDQVDQATGGKTVDRSQLRGLLTALAAFLLKGG